jgi:hypothetical protein
MVGVRIEGQQQIFWVPSESRIESIAIIMLQTDLAGPILGR